MVQEPVDLRTVWRFEDDFTRWLSRDDNLSLLSDVVGAALRTESLQRAVGSLRADLVCTYETDSGSARAIVEVQFTRSDHDHLSKLQFYAGGIPDSHLLVWIAPEFRAEHLRTLHLLTERIPGWRFVPVRVTVHDSDLEGDRPVRLELATLESSVEPRNRTSGGRRASRAPREPRVVTEADDPELIAFITRFIAYLYETRSPLTEGNDIWPSAPSEKPPFAQRNLGVSSLKLKGKILPRAPHDLQVEVLVRRSFTRGDDAAYDQLIDDWKMRTHPVLPGGMWTDEREVRFVVRHTFDAPVLEPVSEAETFRWLAEAMTNLKDVFEPLGADARASR